MKATHWIRVTLCLALGLILSCKTGQSPRPTPSATDVSTVATEAASPVPSVAVMGDPCLIMRGYAGFGSGSGTRTVANVSPSLVKPGDEVTVAVSGFPPVTPLRLYLTRYAEESGGRPLIAEVLSDASGLAQFTFIAPDDPSLFRPLADGTVLPCVTVLVNGLGGGATSLLGYRR